MTLPRPYYEEISELQIGKAGEYLVCADLILKGYIAFPSEQGLPFDVVLAANDRLYKIQVKTTRKPIPVPQRVKRTDKYCFNIRRCGRGGRRSYNEKEVDIFALVALDTKSIGYIREEDAAQTMFFLPETGRQIFVNGKPASGLGRLSELTIEACLKGKPAPKPEPKPEQLEI